MTSKASRSAITMIATAAFLGGPVARADEPRFMNERVLVHVPFRATISSSTFECFEGNDRPGEFKTRTRIRVVPQLQLPDGGLLPHNADVLTASVSGKCAAFMPALRSAPQHEAVGTKHAREIFQLTATGVCLKHVGESLIVKIRGIEFYGGEEMTFEPMPPTDCVPRRAP